jgi:hypothetical protein
MFDESNQAGEAVMTTAILQKSVRDPRSGQVHLPSEEVAIMSIIRNLDRTLLKVRWSAGGECLVFPEELEEIRQDAN